MIQQHAYLHFISKMVIPTNNLCKHTSGKNELSSFKHNWQQKNNTIVCYKCISFTWLNKMSVNVLPSSSNQCGDNNPILHNIFFGLENKLTSHLTVVTNWLKYKNIPYVFWSARSLKILLTIWGTVIKVKWLKSV